MVASAAPIWARCLACTAVAGLAGGALLAPTPVLFFVSGIAAVHLMDRAAIRRFANGWAAPVLILVAFATLPAMAGRLPGGDLGFVAAAIVLVVFTLIVAGCDVFGILRLPALRAVGVASYSIYLFHCTALVASRPVLLRLRDTPLAAWGAVSALTAIVVVAALLSFRWIEFPGIEFGRRWGRRSASPSRPVEA